MVQKERGWEESIKIAVELNALIKNDDFFTPVKLNRYEVKPERQD